VNKNQVPILPDMIPIRYRIQFDNKLRVGHQIIHHQEVHY